MNGLRNAYGNGLPLTLSTDADHRVPGKTRGEVAIEFRETSKAAGDSAGRHPSGDDDERLPRKRDAETARPRSSRGAAADLIAVRENPLENIDALRDVQFVMKDGVVLKRDGVMTPAAFFDGGPVTGRNFR